MSGQYHVKSEGLAVTNARGEWVFYANLNLVRRVAGAQLFNKGSEVSTSHASECPKATGCCKLKRCIHQ